MGCSIKNFKEEVTSGQSGKYSQSKRKDLNIFLNQREFEINF